MTVETATEIQTPARMMKAGARPPRILYAAGTGDILGTYQHWKTRKDDPSQLSVTYSGQFFDLCQRMKYDGFILVHDAHTGYKRDGRFLIRQMRMPRFRNGPGALYHIEQLLAAWRIIFWSIFYRVDVVVAASGAAHWFPLAMLRLIGIKVVPALHCVLWPKFRRPGRVGRLVSGFDRMLFTGAASSLLSASRDIDDQLMELAGMKQARRMRVIPFLPTYRREHFPPISLPIQGTAFRVLYAGRVVREKGIFDLLKAAEILAKENRIAIEFDICGSGGALEEMKRQARQLGLEHAIRFHGHCERPTMVEMFQKCHVVMVPTTTNFVEGFNQVVAEGILAGRPVVTSCVCPAVRYVGDAAVAVPPDDVLAYAQAIVKLAEDKAFYEHCVAACDDVRNQFFDESRGWGAALELAIKTALPQLAG